MRKMMFKEVERKFDGSSIEKVNDNIVAASKPEISAEAQERFDRLMGDDQISSSSAESHPIDSLLKYFSMFLDGHREELSKYLVVIPLTDYNSVDPDGYDAPVLSVSVHTLYEYGHLQANKFACNREMYHKVSDIFHELYSYELAVYRMDNTGLTKVFPVYPLENVGILIARNCDKELEATQDIDDPVLGLYTSFITDLYMNLVAEEKSIDDRRTKYSLNQDILIALRDKGASMSKDEYNDLINSVETFISNYRKEVK